MPVGQEMPPKAPDLPETMADDLDMTPRRHVNEEDREEMTAGANKKIRVCAPQDENDVESLSLVFRKTCFCLSYHVVKKSWLKGERFKAVMMLMICFSEDWVGNMKEFEVSGDVSPGSISLSKKKKGFEEEPLFPAKIFLLALFPCARQAPPEELCEAGHAS